MEHQVVSVGRRRYKAAVEGQKEAQASTRWPRIADPRSWRPLELLGPPTVPRDRGQSYSHGSGEAPALEIYILIPVEITTVKWGA